MNFRTIEIAGVDAITTLHSYRSRYSITREYPFLIGDREDLERIEETAEFNEREPSAIVQASLGFSTAEWMAQRRKEAEEDEFAVDEIMGEWPGEISEKGSIGLHKDVVSGRIKAKVFIGLAQIEQPFQLPAILRYGAWNDCPEPEVHCAIHRQWQERFGAEITGISGDVVECAVKNPPRDRKAATALAWEQYWYCQDIVDQGCGSISNLAATLINSNYWYFWWD